MPLSSRLRLPRRWIRPPRLLAVRAGFLAALAWLEVGGHRGPTDASDVFGIVVLSLLTGTWLALDAPARGALSGTVRRAAAWLSARLPVVGVDLRGEPAVPRGGPVFLRALLAACLAATALETVWILVVREPFRALALRGSYVLLLVATALLWAALVAIVVVSVALVVVLVHDGLRYRHGDAARPRRHVAWLLGYATVVLVGMAWVPDRFALLALVVAVALFEGTAALWPLPRLRMLWRDRDGTIGAFDLRPWLVVQTLFLWWPVALVLVAALGGRAFGNPPAAVGDTPVTDGLGTAAAWLAGPAALVLSAFCLGLLRTVARTDPARARPTTVHATTVEPVPPGAERHARARLEARGWQVRWHPEPPGRADVRVHLVARMGPLPRGRHDRWPLAVSATGLESPELLELIARRDVVQRRRLLLRGLERMLRRARRRPHAKGTGFWIAPQHWFVGGLSRDTSEDELAGDATLTDGMIGEPYHRVIPAAARRHAYELFSALEIDIVFVEDGVSWRSLRRVFHRLFEHHDAGRGRVEERHLHGLPGIRVIVHAFEIGEPLGRDRYPEPDYEDLGRARVLHVFRDRGGEDDREPAPSADRGVPLRA